MSRLHHVAIWVADLQAAAAFWQHYFDADVGDLYESKRQVGFTSRFVTVGDQFRIELMSKPGLQAIEGDRIGWAHLAISLGSREAVDAAAARFNADGRLELGPRTTGDGFYEAMIRGPEGLPIEITI